jgi:hypothetical protein
MDLNHTTFSGNTPDSTSGPFDVKDDGGDDDGGDNGGDDNDD